MTTEFISDFVIDITANQSNRIISLVSEEIQIFLSNLELDNADYDFITPKNQISELNFSGSRKVPFSYFYEHVLSGIQKNNKCVTFRKKVSMTFDKRLCTKFDESSERYYEVIKVGGEPIMYYILFSMDEIYDCLYGID